MSLKGHRTTFPSVHGLFSYMQCIYCIQNDTSKKRYVGSTKKFNKRKYEHLIRLKANQHHSYILQEDWNSLGATNFSFIILEEVSDSNDLIPREQWWIDNSNSEYNISKNAKDSTGIKRRAETIEKVRAANVGLVHPQWRRDIKSKAQGGDNHWTKKKKFSEDAKKRMSESKKRLHENGYKHPCSKTIIQLDLNGNFIAEFESAAAAGRCLGINNISIGHCLRGKHETSGGYKWIFKTVNQ